MFKSLNPEDPIPPESLKIFEKMCNNINVLPEESYTIRDLDYDVCHENGCYMWYVYPNGERHLKEDNTYTHELRIIPLTQPKLDWHAELTLLECDPSLNKGSKEANRVNKENLPKNEKYAVIGLIDPANTCWKKDLH